MPDAPLHAHNFVQLDRVQHAPTGETEDADRTEFHVYGCLCGLLQAHPRDHYERTTPGFKRAFLGLWEGRGFVLMAQPSSVEVKVPRDT